MVTILGPRELIPEEAAPEEAAPASEAHPARPARTYELGYSIPCAGVRFYSFRPTAVAPAVPAFLSAELIDEKVILI